MKKWLVTGGIVAVLIVGGYLVLSYYAVKFIEPYLRKRIRAGLTAGEIKIKTTYLSAKEIRYDDPQSGQRLLRIEEVRVYPSFRSLLTGHPRIREFSILQPVFYISRSREGVFTGPLPPIGKREGDQGNSGQGKRAESESVPIVIDKIRVERGSIDFRDGEYGEPPVGMELNDLTFKIEDIHFPPAPAPSPFELTGRMKGRQKEGEVEARGWIAIQTMNMETFIKVQGIEVKTFEPYYRKRVSAEVESGNIHLEAKISVKQRMIDAPGTIELIDLHIKEGGTVFWVPAQTLGALLKGKDNRIKARFHVKGNMDDPRFNLQETVLIRMGIALAEALGIPIKIVGETILGGAEKGGGGWEEGLKALGEAFKKGKRK